MVATESRVFRRPRLRSVLSPAVWAFWIDELGLLYSLAYVIESFFCPPWVAVNAQGVRIRQWLSRSFYPWRFVERFEIGNRSNPQFAYVIVASTLESTDGGVLAIELPYLHDPSPDQLVKLLAEAPATAEEESSSEEFAEVERRRTSWRVQKCRVSDVKGGTIGLPPLC